MHSGQHNRHHSTIVPYEATSAKDARKPARMTVPGAVHQTGCSFLKPDILLEGTYIIVAAEQTAERSRCAILSVGDRENVVCLQTSLLFSPFVAASIVC